MNFKIFCILVFFSLITGNVVLAENQTSNFPSAIIVDDVFEFNPVLEGTEVINDFIIKNKGTASLEILNVEPGWGSTAVSYPRQIPPGGEGKITIKTVTKKYGGRRIKNNISIETNDPEKPMLALTVTGEVEKLVTITPTRVRLIGPAGQPLEEVVTIIPGEKYPFKIVEVKAINGKRIRYSWSKERGTKGLQYVITVKNIKTGKGRYMDTISVKTTSKYRPEINIEVFGDII